MLSQFSVKNYKSIKDEITLDMQAAKISEHKEKLINGKDNEQYLPLAVIYGPNGGGKSNVLEALYVLISKVCLPIMVAQGQDLVAVSKKRIIMPFLFSEETRENPTEFELFFHTETAEYRYRLHVKKDKIVYESLDRKKFSTKRISGLYERINDNIVLKGELNTKKIITEIADNITFLSFLGITYYENPIIHDVIEWFLNGIVTIDYSNPEQDTKYAINESPETKQLMLNIMQEMDFDIKDFRIEKKPNNTVEIYTMHQLDNQKYELRLGDESSGTQKIFGILPIIIYCLFSGATFVVDELDAKVHPVLLKYIISLFNDKEVNRNNAQILFTSHDLTTMNNEIFRRDEIWFVAKGKEEDSILYSLVEFKTNEGEKTRKDALYSKQYLEGKYGADPYLNKMINWDREYEMHNDR